MNRLKNDSDMICMWCGEATTKEKNNTDTKFKYANKEHILPECIGFKETLPIGDVCGECNNRLSYLDDAIKRDDSVLTAGQQVNPHKPKKTSDQNRKDRREREKNCISPKDKSFTVRRNKEKNGSVGSSVMFINGSFNLYRKDLEKSIHKCTANKLCYEFGGIKTRGLFPELISFVKDKAHTNYKNWNYAKCDADMFSLHRINPQVYLFYLNVKSSDKVDLYAITHMQGGILIAGAKPELINKDSISALSELLLNFIQKNDNNKETYIQHYTPLFSNPKQIEVELKFVVHEFQV